MDFTGKHVFAFGGITGIVVAIAENFAKHGANVSIASRNQQNVDVASQLGTITADNGRITAPCVVP
jgi:NAD(P)-dependent dehydrogenase (short-subunit alcohol dehydrogenase family)